jgi:hypothetical protein
MFEMEAVPHSLIMKCIYNVTCVVEYWNNGTVVPKELGKRCFCGNGSTSQLSALGCSLNNKYGHSINRFVDLYIHCNALAEDTELVQLCVSFAVLPWLHKFNS